MKIAGTAVLHAPADRVWAALNDPAVLVRTIPGCSSLEPNGPDSYRMTVTAGVASVKGVYAGEVALHDQQPPGSFRLRASGAGAPGTVRADVLVELADGGDGTTSLAYDADAVVGGMVGGVGQRMLVGVAKKTAGEFFRAVDGVLAGSAAAEELLLRSLGWSGRCQVWAPRRPVPQALRPSAATGSSRAPSSAPPLRCSECWSGPWWLVGAEPVRVADGVSRGRGPSARPLHARPRARTKEPGRARLDSSQGRLLLSTGPSRRPVLSVVGRRVGSWQSVRR